MKRCRCLPDNQSTLQSTKTVRKRNVMIIETEGRNLQWNDDQPGSGVGFAHIKEQVPPPPHVTYLLSSGVHIIGGRSRILPNLAVGIPYNSVMARGQNNGMFLLSSISKKFPVFTGVGFMANCTKTCYVQNGTKLYIKGNKKRSSYGCVVDVPHVESFVRLKVGDLLVITRDSSEEQHESASNMVGSPRDPLVSSGI
ncbi:hypothetical protein Tco_1320498 [Tanacetum coccineum]